MIRYMKKLIQLITVAMGVFMVLKGTAGAADGSYAMFFKEVGVEHLGAEVIIHDAKPYGQDDSKEIKLMWMNSIKSKDEELKIVGKVAMDDVTGQFQKDVRAEALMALSF